MAALYSVSNAAVRLPHIFSDGMVLQREKPVPIWGWAKPGEKVTVKFAGQAVSSTTGADGRWMLKLNPLSTSDKPRELSVTGTDTLVFKDVLVGDVWLCSGDFGVYYEVFASANAEAEIAAANYPTMRLLKVASATSNTPLSDIQGQWMTCSPTSVSNFSALAYYFGRALHRELKVPIGVIDCSYRYSYIRSWLAPEGFRMIPELKESRDRMDSWNSTTDVGQKSFGEAVSRVEQWLPLADKAFRKGTPIPQQPLMPAPITGRDEFYQTIGELSAAYHGMVHPIIPFAIRGVVWSQGENGGEAETRQAHMQGLIEGWRKQWGQGDFPVYFELLPRVDAPSATPCVGGDHWTTIREGQLKSVSIPNTGAAVTFDVSDYVSDNRNRQDAGQRLALWALAKEYHEDIVYSGPTYRSHRIEGDSVTISFDNIGGGLMAGEKNDLAPTQELKPGVLRHFAIAGEDKKWQWADARIVGDTVVLRSDKVPTPVAVRYAWCPNPQAANLYNRDGLPAAPFRTDTW